MIRQKAEMTVNHCVGGPYYRMDVACPDIAADAEPGQFVMIRTDGGEGAFLARPFSIHRCHKEHGITLLYKVVGKGTREMAALQAGGFLYVVGPLGKGFETGSGLGRTAMVGGGVGVAPLVFLAERLAEAGVGMENNTVYLGGATETDILCRDRFAETGMAVRVATEDGSDGEKGLVTDVLINDLAGNASAPDMVFACGPLGMIAALDRIARQYGIPCQISFETMMACGIGACLGCAVPVNKGSMPYLHACKDGPVFDSRMIDWKSLQK